MNNYDMTEMNRALSNMIRVGNIRAVDVENARVRVAFGGCVSDWLPWGTSRAGNRRDWTAPNVGEQVMVFSPFGDPTQAVVGPSIFQDDFNAPASSADQDTTVYPDGTTVDYNSATNTLTIDVAGNANIIINCKVATVHAENSVTLDTPETTVTGNLTVAKSFTMGQEGGSATMKGNVAIEGGSLTHNGKNVGSTHTHGGVQSGGSNTASPN